MKKARLNYWVDVGVGISFVLSAVSGLIFLLPVSSDSGLGSRVLGISYTLWSQLHTWGSLGLMASVLAHLVLHWKWIVGMTRKMLSIRKVPQEEAIPAPDTEEARRLITRRQFLRFGLVTIAAGAVTAGYALIFGTEAAGVEQQQLGVACPRGMVNGPYPGQCRHYTDRNGDGVCDYSVPGSGNN